MVLHQHTQLGEDWAPECQRPSHEGHAGEGQCGEDKTLAVIENVWVRLGQVGYEWITYLNEKSTCSLTDSLLD